ncbi:MGDG synthase family glycosyltransferase [Peribacillus sp. SCS-155]|uniref:MGDG synthase family glycosyltransferase n=1 Tax=Peribacillus sedimenti TaxID=3115297 RepID=UPI003905EB8E
MDLLSYTNGSLEKVITSSYLNWIRFAPESYNLAYKNFFYEPSNKINSFKWYEHIFLRKMEQMVIEEQPDLIVCTHGFPSHLLSQLKSKGKCNVPVINVYTDYFINNVWGLDGIDLHFLPSQEAKASLLYRKNQKADHSIIVTGIPIHEEFTARPLAAKKAGRPKILVSGGNSGLGGILRLSADLKNSLDFDFVVLCGKNQKLYHEILSWNIEHVKPMPYLTSRSEMNSLYDQVSAIITKPGGVTVSEALYKRIPIFVHSALPGQEEINLHFLQNKGLVFQLNSKQSIGPQLASVLNNQQQMNRLNKSLDYYQKTIELQSPDNLKNIIGWLLDHQTALTRQA